MLTPAFPPPPADKIILQIRPYKHSRSLFVAQILSLITYLTTTWTWFYVVMTIGFIPMILLQITWCCRMPKSGFQAVVILTIVMTLLCIYDAIHKSLRVSSRVIAAYYPITSIIGAILWSVVTCCMIRFLWASTRQLEKNDDDDGKISNIHHQVEPSCELEGVE